MTSEDIERTRRFARDLVDLLVAYEAELTVAGPDTPAVGELHRALGTAVTQACRLACLEADPDAAGAPVESRSWRQ